MAGGPYTGNTVSKGYAGLFPIVSYACSSYQINGGTAIAAGEKVTETITFTGVTTADDRIALSSRKGGTGMPLDPGLKLVSAKVTATNTVTVTWENVSDASITPGAATTLIYCHVMEPIRFG